ncbi:hypothetical protein MPH_01695 [Macrophomina phaseolina MS6]|uniref:ASTRA-associated protein 1 n=1 Tax=Macrophomina phaseolina (strain MS6) TaxID=1126212 RepID=K2REQ0_MACPH|nr:hypothetical protein MPH_01695 [Macrophomina phaseolina MS6]
MSRPPPTGCTALPLQQAERPPAQPAYVFRGHSAQVHAVRFVRHNSRLLTGDADGWAVLWNLATKRPAAVWRAHQSALLGFGDWGGDNLITHGRDFHIRVWQLRPTDESQLSTVLPVEDATTERKNPWLLHALRVNTLNFCSFAMCSELATSPATPSATVDSVLIAVPGVRDDEVDVFQLPSERRVSTVPNIGQKTGMAMALSLIHRPSPSGAHLHCISAYESGAAAVHAFDATSTTWSRIYTSQPHSQPVLSLSPSPSLHDITFFTSGADDVVAKHFIPLARPEVPPPAKPAAPAQPSSSTADAKPKSLLSAALAAQPPEVSSAASPQQPSPTPVEPVKVVRTKHSGQQSLTVRSDGRILATAGWDGRVRVYSVKSMKEIAVLAWHKEGCYATAFADVGAPEGEIVESGGGHGHVDAKGPDGSGGGEAIVKSDGQRQVGRMTVRSRRDERARSVHWIAVGSKDGKVSLWEVF